MENTLRLNSANNKIVVVDLEHLYLHEGVIPFLEKVISNLTILQVAIHKETIDMGYQVGFADCVSVGETDEIVYAKRVGRFIYSKFVKNREPEPTNNITVVLKRMSPNKYKLLTAYIGNSSEKEIEDRSISTEEELNTCIAFWNTHALVLGSCEVDNIIEGVKVPKTPKKIKELRKSKGDSTI